MEILKANETQSSGVPVDTANWAGQLVNHNIFWKSMTPESNAQASAISPKLNQKILTDYKTFDVFGNTIVTKAKSIFGAGWTWVVYNKRSNTIDVMTTRNGGYPQPIDDISVLFNIDIWEHSYYLDYATNREEYVKNVLAVLNWAYISDLFEASLRQKLEEPPQ
jgi:Fe-Mn family superoxide dismutase